MQQCHMIPPYHYQYHKDHVSIETDRRQIIIITPVLYYDLNLTAIYKLNKVKCIVDVVPAKLASKL